MDPTSNTMLTASSSPLQLTFALPSDSHKVKGTALLLQVTKNEACLKVMSQNLTKMLEKSTRQDAVIQELKTDHQRISKDLEKAHRRITELDGDVGELLVVVQDLLEKHASVTMHITGSEDLDSLDEGMTAADQEKIKASLTVYSDTSFKVCKPGFSCAEITEL